MHLKYGTFIYMKKKNIRTSSKSAPRSKPKTKKLVKQIKKKTVQKPKKSIRKPPVIREMVVGGKRPTDIQILEQFFGSPVLLKLWKVLALNSTREFTLKDFIRLTKTKSDILIVNLKELMKQGVIQGTKKIMVNSKQQKEKVIVYSIVKEFPLLPEIIQLILTAIPRSPEKVLTELNTFSRLKTVVLSGFFTSKLGLSTPLFSATQSPIDMLLIFEKIPANISETIGELEHKLGRDLRYAALDQEDFKYRHSIGDKLIRDVLDFEHIVAMDKMSFFR